MSRIVLLHLPDSQVDVLSQVRTEDPGADLLVVHPRKEALIRRLARIAEIPALDAPPDPCRDDLVVAPERIDQPLLTPWRDLGARIISPGEFQEGRRPSRVFGKAPAPEETTPAPEETTRVSEETGTSAGRENADVPSGKEKTPEAAMQSRQGSMDEQAAARELEMLATPEASFVYLVDRTMGENARVTLWWDGQINLWTPWLGEASAAASPDRRPEGLFWETTWGGFVLSGEGVKTADWNRGALKRISEDLALRDLMSFNREIENHPILRETPGAARLGNWLEAATGLLKPQAAMAWIKKDTRWQLDGVFGNGIIFSGSLKLDDSLLRASFGSGRGWEFSSWGDTVRVYWRFAENQGRWPLYLKRLTATESREE